MESVKNFPKDASAVILLKNGEVFLAQRNPKLSFLGGWHAFPGGKTDAGDTEIAVRNLKNESLQRFIVGAVRETFEETGILLVRGGDKMTKGQRLSLLDDLISGRSSFAEILAHWELWIEAEDFVYTGYWTTPQFSPVRFKTRFFMANCPSKQHFAVEGELVGGHFLAPQTALEKWSKGEILISPPVLIALKELQKTTKIYGNLEKQEAIEFCAKTLAEKSAACDGEIDFIEFNPHVTCFPLKTETLPPATHTNCFIVGKKEFIVIDAASKDSLEQAKLHAFIDDLIAHGGICREIIVTHSHSDHYGGEGILQKHLKEKHRQDVPISAHRLTIEKLAGRVEFQKEAKDGDIFDLRDENGESFEITALDVPGHDFGHLNFYDEKLGFLLSSDNVINASSIIIAPPRGNMIDYLQTLERLKNLPNLLSLCGSHGAAVFDAKSKIESYIEHRLRREAQVIGALEKGAKTSAEVVKIVYPNLRDELFKFAEKSVEAHLEKLKAEGKL